VDDLLFVKVATRIGCGIVAGMSTGADGAMATSAACNPRRRRRLCRCGSRGCVRP
jgi:hypothetical protein